MASNFYLRDLCNQLHKLDIDEPSLDCIKHDIQEKCAIPILHQQLWHNGKRITNNAQFEFSACCYHEISVSLSLCGGKGGFGSMLRAAGKLNKTTNKSAMRDLSGRRHRFVEQENELREWIKLQKSTKPMGADEIQNDFRHIKEFGTLPEKRMCHRGIACRSKWNCKFRHPEDTNSNTPKHKEKAQQIAPLHHQTETEMRNALLMGKMNAKHTGKHSKNKNKNTKKKVIALFGSDVAAEQDLEMDLDKNKKKKNDVNIREISHKSHAHKLKCIIREDCDFVICDFCMKQYQGASWHCCKNCDFDLCDDCVFIDFDKCLNIPMDAHLQSYYAESNEMKQIQQSDRNSMQIKSFSSSMDRKRKRKEKKLNLLGLETVKSVKVNGTDKNEMFVNRKGVEGDVELDAIADVNELKSFGMEKLKNELEFYGLKCGGTLQERAERLFLLKGNKLCELPKHCFVSKKRKKKFKKPPPKKQKIAQ